MTISHSHDTILRYEKVLRRKVRGAYSQVVVEPYQYSLKSGAHLQGEEAHYEL